MSLFPDAPPASTAPADWIYAHCDGGSRGNPGPAGYGALVTDAQGNVLAELSEFLGKRTNNFAEYSGLLAVLAWALEHGHRRLKVVSDSELMVKQVQGRYKVNSPDLKPLCAEARARAARLDGFEITHALRHKNKEADALANLAMDRGMGLSAGKRGSDEAVDSLPLRARPAGERTLRLPGQPATDERLVPGPVGSSLPSKPATAGAMLRGFTKGGVVHLLGGAELPDGVFVKVIRE